MSVQIDFILGCTVMLIGTAGMTGFAIWLAHREGKLPPWRQFRRMVWRNFIANVRKRWMGL